MHVSIAANVGFLQRMDDHLRAAPRLPKFAPRTTSSCLGLLNVDEKIHLAGTKNRFGIYDSPNAQVVVGGLMRHGLADHPPSPRPRLHTAGYVPEVEKKATLGATKESRIAAVALSAHERKTSRANEVAHPAPEIVKDAAAMPPGGTCPNPVGGTVPVGGHPAKETACCIPARQLLICYQPTTRMPERLSHRRLNSKQQHR